MKAENTALRAANEQLSQRRKRKKKFLKEKTSLTVQEGLELIDQMAINTQLEAEQHPPRSKRVRTEKGPRLCGACRQPGHRKQTCPMASLNTV
jgi:hypothetical protein